MTDTALLEKLDLLARTVERLENRVEDLEDHRDLQTAIVENAGKPLVEWEQAKKLLGDSGEQKRRPSNQHVVKREDGWAVRGDNAKKDTSRHDTQHAAVERAKKIATHQKAEVVIHGRDGKIRDKTSYGSDPRPPSDRRR